MPRRTARIAAATAAWLVTSALAPPIHAQSQIDVLLHGTGVQHARTGSRDGGYAAGLYATWGADWRHLVETDVAYTRIRYVQAPDLEQVDVVAAYSHFRPRGSVRLGGHWIESTDPLSDGGIIVFGGASAYRPGVWSTGVEAALSRYAGRPDGLTVLQLAPSAGFSAGDPRGGGSLGAVLRGYWIRHSTDVVTEGRTFVSGEAAVYLTFGAITLSGTGWHGEQSFAVRNGGMLVYNLAEVHTGGYGGGVRWVITRRAALSAGLYAERIRAAEPGRNENVRALTAALGLTL